MTSIAPPWGSCYIPNLGTCSRKAEVWRVSAEFRVPQEPTFLSDARTHRSLKVVTQVCANSRAPATSIFLCHLEVRLGPPTHQCNQSLSKTPTNSDMQIGAPGAWMQGRWRGEVPGRQRFLESLQRAQAQEDWKDSTGSYTQGLWLLPLHAHLLQRPYLTWFLPAPWLCKLLHWF